MQHFNIDSEMIQMFLTNIDQNNNNEIDYREFIAATIRKKLFGDKDNTEKNMSLLIQSFNYFDIDENG